MKSTVMVVMGEAARLEELDAQREAASDPVRA